MVLFEYLGGCVVNRDFGGILSKVLQPFGGSGVMGQSLLSLCEVTISYLDQ
ncbi:hypothetical protein CA13_21630 [Planctomycetes bacterium CA13]|uniref:Uncharacterized protein n=1 Tax=Novipirellula herctigrandis TaxID=2527986 RepID=A0A5C5Z1D8_9BACT|nr:hypothetical protein CA13_21630 [Planctomycetes bacterium CA13]